jgi:hypothetical protein
VVKPAVDYMLVNVDGSALPGVLTTSQYLVLPDRPVGAKPLDRQFRDSWNIGFTPQLAVGV